MEGARSDVDHYNDEGQRRRYGASHELWKQGVDVTDLVSETTRKHGLEFFLSFRMNDYHHGSWEEHPRWWLAHREMTVGKGQPPADNSPAAMRRIAGLDFTHPEVREHVMAPIVARGGMLRRGRDRTRLRPERALFPRAARNGPNP